MLIKALGLFLAFVSVPIGNAYALSCMPPQGDQVLQAVAGQKSPVWFGRAKLKSVTDDQDAAANVVATFEIEETYFISSSETVDGEVSVAVPSFQRTWGPWGLVSGKSQIKAGSVGQYFLTKHEGAWRYSGPGACTYFSDEEWEQLKSGYYNDKIQLKVKEETDAD